MRKIALFLGILLLTGCLTACYGSDHMQVDDYSVYLDGRKVEGLGEYIGEGPMDFVTVYFSEQDKEYETRRGLKIGDSIKTFVERYDNIEVEHQDNYLTNKNAETVAAKSLTHLLTLKPTLDGAVFFISYVYKGKLVTKKKSDELIQYAIENQVDVPLVFYHLTVRIRDETVTEITIDKAAPAMRI